MKQLAIKYLCIILPLLLANIFLDIPLMWVILAIISFKNMQLNHKQLISLFIASMVLDFAMPTYFGINMISISAYFLVISLVHYLWDIPPTKIFLTYILAFFISTITAYLITYISLSILQINLFHLIILILGALVARWFIIQLCKKINITIN